MCYFEVLKLNSFSEQIKRTSKLISIPKVLRNSFFASKHHQNNISNIREKKNRINREKQQNFSSLAHLETKKESKTKQDQIKFFFLFRRGKNQVYIGILDPELIIQ